MVLGLIMIMGAFAIPTLRSSRRTYHLNQAATTITGAVQAARYRAIQTGCPYTITIPQTDAAFSNTTYLLQTQVLSGNPPACAGAYTNVYPNPGTIPWATTKDVSLAQAVTLQFNPNGLVQANAGTLTLVLSNGLTTNTITVSGVGNAKTTSP